MKDHTPKAHFFILLLILIGLIIILIPKIFTYVKKLFKIIFLNP